MKDVAVLFWFQCPECQHVWVSENDSPNREWCYGCVSEVSPELLYEEQVQL